MIYFIYSRLFLYLHWQWCHMTISIYYIMSDLSFKNELELSFYLDNLEKQLFALVDSSGVSNKSALYGSLVASLNALSVSKKHVDEFLFGL